MASVQKGPQAFRTISEAAEAVGSPQHVLRFWETKFAFIQPVKRAGGRRFYRPQDIVLLKAIRRLLHDEGLTIKGVQRLHKDQGLARIVAYGDPDADFVLDAGDRSQAPVAAMPTSPANTGSPERAETGLNGSGAVRLDVATELRALLADIEAARTRLDAVLTG